MRSEELKVCADDRFFAQACEDAATGSAAAFEDEGALAARGQVNRQRFSSSVSRKLSAIRSIACEAWRSRMWQAALAMIAWPSSVASRSPALARR
jgi:hypothetical protein